MDFGRTRRGGELLCSVSLGGNTSMLNKAKDRRKLLTAERGTGVVEYALLSSLIALFLIPAVGSGGYFASTTYGTVAAAIGGQDSHENLADGGSNATVPPGHSDEEDTFQGGTNGA